MVDRIIVRFFDEQRDLECVPPRGREGREHVAENTFEQISEPGVGERALGLGRARRENTEVPSPRFVDAGEPQR